MKKQNRGFTLIELLIVIVILGVLALAVILILNPAEMLKKGRDSTRLSDATTLRSAISLYISDVDPASISMGTAGQVYCSLEATGGTTCPPAAADCDICSSTPYANSGAGWIPINFTSISSGTPISKVPLDPTNTNSTQYYRYECDASGNFEIDSVMESTYYTTTDKVAEKDGGNNADRYEAGSKLDLL